MTKIDWNSSGRWYNSGVEKVVIYAPQEPGVPWFGVSSISEGSEGGEIDSFYQDGIKYLQIPRDEDFTMSLSAYSTPEQFDRCDGVKYIALGMYATQQDRKPFGLTYRTNIVSGDGSFEDGFLLHIVYNCMASPSEIKHESLSDDPDVSERTWEISTVGIDMPESKPIAHVVLDSRLVPQEVMDLVFSYIYGSTTTEPILLTPDQLMALSSGEDLDFDIDGSLGD